MSINILQLVMDSVTPGILEKLSGLLGENSGAVSKALGGAAPAILGALLNKGSTAEGASGLMGLLANSGIGANFLGGLGDMLGDSTKSEGLAKMGGGLVTQLLGDKAGGVAEAVAGLGGLKAGSASALLGLVAPLVLGGVAKAAPAGMDAQGLMGLLAGQKDFLAKAAPAGFLDKLGIPGLAGLAGLAGAGASAATSAASAVGGAAIGAATETAKKGMGILPWLLGAAAIAALIFGLRSCGGSEKAAETPAPAPAVEATPAPEAAPPPVESAAPAGPAVEKLKLPDGSELEIVGGGALSQLYAFINSADAAPKTFTFDGLTFDTGKATLKAESTEIVNDAIAIMKAYPAVEIKLEGHTDNVGAAASNQRLSQARASTVKAALVAGGIDAKRVAAVGYGQDRPKADNATDEGKAQNRRIDLVVTKK
jgi:OmpA-OmpF porin, OOP family